MRLALIFVATLPGAIAAPLEGRQVAAGGTGPYAPVTYFQDSSIPNHTLYKPSNANSTRLPVMLWSNGGCSADSLSSQPFLQQHASYGVLIIASGTPLGQTRAGKGAYANVDASRIVAVGWSCGGIEACAQIWDSRVSSIGIWSSGLLTNQTAATQFKKPIFYFLGGPTDIAYANGERDYSNMPAGIPKWKGNLPVGHLGTYREKDGGKFGIIGARWVEWVMRGNATAAEYLTGAGAKNDGWSVVSADLANLKVTPI
ncbi:hypothetical protein CC80DRAFT_567170 [Byssothecium circinans]|uniref:Alpha/beta-hydrolase n=1 Tax=Byssothecium circinans TaxID=147558 RepID=A0A6A5TNW3_9PLEO|nr:hypothetical protein CC80DRAFT_567170 [Byssothecium circinans]